VRQKRTRGLRSLKPTEADTMKAICDYLDRRGILYIRHNPYSMASDKAGGHLRFRKPRVSQLGAPDLVIWYQNEDIELYMVNLEPVVAAVEVKAPGKLQNKDQVLWEAKAVARGAKYAVVRSLDELLEFLRSL